MCDYLFIRPQAYTIETLDERSALNLRAFTAWLLGAVLTLLTAENIVPTLSGIAAIDAIVLSGGVYTLLSWGQRDMPPQIKVSA